MSAKTKIVVLHMKELIYTAIFAALGILLLALLAVIFMPDKKEGADKASGQPTSEGSLPDTQGTSSPEAAPSASDSVYIPGIYTTELVLGGQSVNVEVIVDAASITSIQLVNLSETVTTMYPLLQPAFDSICEQIYDTQSLDQVTYSPESKYTSLVLLEAIRTSLEKALISDNG